MSKCPSCGQQIATPSMLSLRGWAEFVCPQCRARLEAKTPRSTMLGILMPIFFFLGREGRIFEITAVAFMVATFTCFIIEAWRPQLRFKKPLPEPEIRLNLVGE
ncbi:MAG TPA: hypothetical protein VG498_00315 [Terriglobales bacterium]|nr:hypothetical protein [Terriglobales bacterium]